MNKIICFAKIICLQLLIRWCTNWWRCCCCCWTAGAVGSPCSNDNRATTRHTINTKHCSTVLKYSFSVQFFSTVLQYSFAVQFSLKFSTVLQYSCLVQLCSSVQSASLQLYCTKERKEEKKRVTYLVVRWQSNDKHFSILQILSKLSKRVQENSSLFTTKSMVQPGIHEVCWSRKLPCIAFVWRISKTSIENISHLHTVTGWPFKHGRVRV